MVQDMYEGYKAAVRCAGDMTDELKVQVGLYQDLLFALVMKRQESPWTDVYR